MHITRIRNPLSVKHGIVSAVDAEEARYQLAVIARKWQSLGINKKGIKKKKEQSAATRRPLFSLFLIVNFERAWPAKS